MKAGQVSRRRTPKQQNGGKKRRARLQGKLGRNGGEREEGGMEGGREGGREEGREGGRKGGREKQIRAGATQTHLRAETTRGKTGR